MMDYSVWERIGEALGFGDSLGPAQVTVSVARANDLLPRHDAVPWKIAEQTADLRANPEAGVNQAIERLRRQRVKDRRSLRDPKENIDVAARLIGIYLKTLKNAMGSVNDGTWGGIPIEVVERALLMRMFPPWQMPFDLR